MDPSSLIPLFKGTLVPDTDKLRAATAALEAEAVKPGFAIALFAIAADESTDFDVRLSASTYAVNHIRRHWQDEENTGGFSDADRDAIKANIVGLMISVPHRIQKQISSAVAYISLCDFPESWENLMPDLVAQIKASPDITVMNGILETACAVFERFRGAPGDDNDTLFPLKTALDGFAPTLQEIFAAVDTQTDAAIAGNQGPEVLRPLFRSLGIMANIFYLLNCVDLPEFFEENLQTWMDWFHKYMCCNNAVVSSAVDDDEEGPLEILQGSILQSVALYADKYDEEFESSYPTFVKDVWDLLSSQSKERLMAENMDNLVTRSMRFLASVISKQQHAQAFNSEEALSGIFALIVAPNLQLRENDVDSFNENVMEFVRADVEGNDADTRRRVATDLVRALCRTANDIATPIALSYVSTMLADYNAAKDEKAIQKDAAVAFMIAVAVKSSTESKGVTEINEKVDLGDFLNNHIFSELVAEEANSRPIAKASAIKFVASFRSLFDRDQIHAVLPLLVPFLSSESLVVHSYAAAAIERMLNVKDKDAATGRNLPRCSPEALQPLVPELLGPLFSRIATDGYPENEYLMRCILRIVAVSKEHVAPLAEQIIGAITTVLARVCKNPSNPTFNHYLFETVASLMRSICTAHPEIVSDFEAMVFPPFQHVLTTNVVDFLPYVFQLLAELLDLKPAPLAGAHSLSEAYQSILSACLVPEVWQSKGNVPALTELMSSFVRRGSNFIIENGLLDGLCGVWAKLMGAKNEEGFAFSIMDAMIAHMPTATLDMIMPQLLQITMQRLHTTKAMRIGRALVHSCALLAGVHGAETFVKAVKPLGDSTIFSLLGSVFVGTGNRIIGDTSRKETAVGITRILCEFPELFTNENTKNIWTKLVGLAVELLTVGPPDDSSNKPARAAMLAAQQAAGHAIFAEENEEDEALGGGGGGVLTEGLPAEYAVEFYRLVHAHYTAPYAFATSIPDAREFLVDALVRLSASGAGGGAGVVKQLVDSSASSATINSWCAAKGVVL